MTMATCVQLKTVSKTFFSVGQSKNVLDQISWNIPTGSITGILGSNGAGKSTALKLIMGFIFPTQGSISVLGFPAGSMQAKIKSGFTPENPRFPKFMTGRDFLKLQGSIRGLSLKQISLRSQHVLECVKLEHAQNEIISTYSKGMTQRLALASALLSEPEILILDEPMSGLDVMGRSEMRQLLQNIFNSSQKLTVVLSTHLPEDILELCSHLYLIKNHKSSSLMKTSDFLSQHKSGRYEIRLSTDNLSSADIDFLEKLNAEPFSNGYRITSDKPTQTLQQIEANLSCPYYLHSVQPEKDPIYLAINNNEVMF